MQRSGGCLCKAVRFTAQLKGDELGACHCSMCRRWSGGTYLSVSTTDVQFEATDELRTYASSAWAERGFCGQCGSSLFYRLTAGGGAQGQMHLAAGSLDDLTGLRLSHQVFIDHKPEGYSFAQDTHDMTEAEVFAKYAP